jgi:type IV pilus assembly protein PilW
VHCGNTSCTAAELTDTVAVKLWVLARTDEATPGYTDTKTYSMGSNPVVNSGPFNDSFKRHVFSTTVRINNVAGRRETPL